MVRLYLLELSLAFFKLDPALLLVGLSSIKLSTTLVRLDPVLVFVGLYSAMVLDSLLVFEYFPTELSTLLVRLGLALDFWLCLVELFFALVVNDGLSAILAIAATILEDSVVARK